ncbi:hypothetical protein Q5P01_005180 [Channa striata]|uniref:Uncharacterized protein n=1 Tax=Channa striata TaxID=64152 RepID=A0AA88NI34_CHASR|nr:hypothetical protein Q5P01_005180 [Channa striata]
MAAGTAEGDAHMEDLVDQGLGMEETAHGLLRRPSLREIYHSDSLLAPNTDFMTDCAKTPPKKRERIKNSATSSPAADD